MDPIWHDSGMEREWIGVSNEMDLNFKNLWLIISMINLKSNLIFLLERKSIVNNY